MSVGAARLRIMAVGPGATIQDAGRFGLLRFGVTPSGPMDWAAHRTANLALGNDPGAAAVEISIGGIVVRADTAVTLAFAGGGFRWSRDDQALPIAARITLRSGETLKARAGAWGSWAYLAVPGGIDVPAVMGSRATHLRSALGGLEGRALAAGDHLDAARSTVEGGDAEIGTPWLKPDREAIGVVLGPQDDLFTPDAVTTLFDSTWTVSGTADRMAYKLTGPMLRHRGDFNIVSDGVALGAIQVAGDGQPMVLMADRQPTGGYPKIGHVRRADIGRLAQSRAGDTCRFTGSFPAEARRALLALENVIDGVTRRSTPLHRMPSADRLAASNLIGGVTDAFD